MEPREIALQFAKIHLRDEVLLRELDGYTQLFPQLDEIAGEFASMLEKEHLYYIVSLLGYQPDEELISTIEIAHNLRIFSSLFEDGVSIEDAAEAYVTFLDMMFDKWVEFGMPLIHVSPFGSVVISSGGKKPKKLR
jgi:hypothetical protein